LLFGMPTQVASTGRMRGEVVEYFTSQFRFANANYVVSATSGTIAQQGRSFTHGYEIHFEKATLLFEFAVIGGEGRTLMPVTVLNAKGQVETPNIVGDNPVDAFVNEIKEVTKAFTSGKP